MSLHCFCATVRRGYKNNGRVLRIWGLIFMFPDYYMNARGDWKEAGFSRDFMSHVVFSAPQGTDWLPGPLTGVWEGAIRKEAVHDNRLLITFRSAERSFDSAPRLLCPNRCVDLTFENNASQNQQSGQFGSAALKFVQGASVFRNPRRSWREPTRDFEDRNSSLRSAPPAATSPSTRSAVVTLPSLDRHTRGPKVLYSGDVERKTRSTRRSRLRFPVTQSAQDKPASNFCSRGIRI